MRVGIVDYEGGNLASVARAVEHLGFDATVTSDPDVLLKSDRVIFPGVGAAGSAMAALKKAELIPCLKDGLKGAKIPCLGICIGIQVLFDHSEEDDQDTLGLIGGKVKRFPRDAGITVPHIGWNRVQFRNPSDPLLKGLSEGHFYFVNSYYVVPDEDAVVLGECEYGPIRFAAMVRKDNWVASQFHLEKSGPLGLKVLNNFLRG
jgi:glutamine amidotransferase